MHHTYLASVLGRAGAVNVSVTPFGDSRTAIMHYDTTHFNGATASVHNWMVARHAQPVDYTGNFGVSGDTTVQMQARIAAPLSAAQAAAVAGKRSYVTLWCGVNDVGTLSDSAATIAGRFQSMAASFQAVGVRPIICRDAGSETLPAVNVQKLIDMNALMQQWVIDHATDAMKPIWCDLAASAWFSAPDATQTDNSVAASQTASAGVPLTLASSTISGGRKLLFTHSEAVTRTVNVVGTLGGQGRSETVTLLSTATLKSSTNVYDVITSITPVAAFTNPLKVGATGVVMKEGYTYDGLHLNLTGAYNVAEALYASIIADCTPVPIIRAGTQLLLNPSFTTLIGGTLGANTTVSSGVTPPINWRTNNSNVVDITAADFFFANDGTCVWNLTSSSSATGSASTAFLRHDPAVGLFTAGDVCEIWMDVLVSAGAVGLAGVSVELSMNYAAGTKLYYANRNSASTGGVIPSTADQTLRFRFPQIVIDAGTINTVNFFVRAYMNGAGNAVLKTSALRLQKN